MGLFSKKYCDVCGDDIGLLGNRKLADGNLCKNCAKKLSPWMSDRRQTSVAEIKQHLAYRDQNLRMLANMHPTAALGTRTKVYIDADNRRFFVSANANWRDANPDIVSFDQVIDVRTEVTEHRIEQYHRDREGKNVPFNPPRYRFTYEFDTTILVDSPYFNEMRFELTDDRPERIESSEYCYFEEMAASLKAALMAPAPAAAPKQTVAQTLSAAIGSVVASAGAQAAAQAAGGQWTCACGAANSGNFCTQCGAKRPEKPKTYRCDKCGWTPEDPAKPPKFCPNCGDPFNTDDAV